MEGKTRVPKKKAAPVVKEPRSIPAPLEAELQKIAQEILLERSTEARKVAALETANKLLARVAELLAIANAGKPSPQAVAMLKPSPVVKNPCINCGLEGTFRPKPDKFNPKPNWLCAVHAGAYQMDQLETRNAEGLLGSLRAAAPIDDSALPE
jgi:hypothetical protein